MKKLAAYILLLFASFTAGAATNALVTFNYQTLIGPSGSRMNVTLTPTDEPRTNGTAIVIGIPVTKRTDANGLVTFTNVAWGTNAFYRAQAQAQGKVSTLYILVESNITYNAADILVETDRYGGLIFGYTRAQIAAMTNGIGTNYNGIIVIKTNGVTVATLTGTLVLKTNGVAIYP